MLEPRASLAIGRVPGLEGLYRVEPAHDAGQGILDPRLEAREMSFRLDPFPEGDKLKLDAGQVVHGGGLPGPIHQWVALVLEPALMPDLICLGESLPALVEGAADRQPDEGGEAQADQACGHRPAPGPLRRALQRAE